MSILTLKNESYESVVSREGIVLVDCWASWCRACMDFAPVFQNAAHDYPEITYARLDTEAEFPLVEALGIQNIPTLILYRDGIMLLKQPGYFDEKGLENIIAQAVKLDMELVKREIALEQSGSKDEKEEETSNG